MTDLVNDYKSIFAQRGSRYEAAMQRHPGSRAEEFEMVTRPLQLNPGDRVADIPSGGGYLANYLPDGVELLAVEPVAGFGSSSEVSGNHPGRLCCPVDKVPLPDASLQAIVSLAGLHHHADKSTFYREAHRLLAPGGQLIVADGHRDTPVADFLNGFVDRHNPEGHKGRFLGPECADQIAAAGFEIDSAELQRYHWHFPTRPAAADFCRDLFGLNCPEPVLLTALENELALGPGKHGWQLRWELLRVCAHSQPCRG